MNIDYTYNGVAYRIDHYYDPEEGMLLYRIDRFVKGKWRLCFGGIQEFSEAKRIIQSGEIESRMRMNKVLCWGALIFCIIIFTAVYFISQ